jgi:hypothetical protein
MRVFSINIGFVGKKEKAPELKEIPDFEYI